MGEQNVPEVEMSLWQIWGHLCCSKVEAQCLLQMPGIFFVITLAYQRQGTVQRRGGCRGNGIFAEPQPIE